MGVGGGLGSGVKWEFVGVIWSGAWLWDLLQELKVRVGMAARGGGGWGGGGWGGGVRARKEGDPGLRGSTEQNEEGKGERGEENVSKEAEGVALGELKRHVQEWRSKRICQRAQV